MAVTMCNSESINDSIGETNRIGIGIGTTSYIQSFSGSVSSLQRPFPSQPPFDLNPSTTPSIALPYSVSIKITSIGLAVA